MILLSLLGEQPIPNLLPLWQFPHYHAVRFAATPDTLPLAENLKSAIASDPILGRLEVLPPLELPAYDIAQARLTIADALIDSMIHGLEVEINLTGGTKIMSLAALQAAYGSGVGLLYVSTQENCNIHLGSDGAEIRRTPIQVKIDVRQYLAAHGLDVSNNASFIDRPEIHRKPQVGNNLEELVFRKALESGRFDDVQRGVFIRKTLPSEVKNELDIVVTSNGRLGVCSCKAGSQVTKEMIYELSSLSRRESFGIYCGKVLAFSTIEIPEAIRDRARAMGVHLVYGPELNNVAEHLYRSIHKS